MRALRCPVDGQLLEVCHKRDGVYECPRCDGRLPPADLEVVG